MPKLRGKATIVLLYGSSTAGKTTICKKLQEEGETLGLPWVVDGTDLAFERLGLDDLNEILDDHFSKVMAGDDFEEARKVLTVEEIVQAVDTKKIVRVYLGEQSGIPAEQQVEKIYSSLGSDEQPKYSKPIIQALLSLLAKHENIIKDYPPPDPIMNDIMSCAIENSKRGVPTVLDFVPISGELISEFEKHLEERNFSCPTIVAIVHCPIHNLVDRMEERNRLARLPKTEGGREDLNDLREGFFPYRQYARIFGASSGGVAEPRIIGSVTRADVLRAAEKFGEQEAATTGAGDMPLKPKVEAEALDLMRKLGFPEDESKESIDLVTRCYHDRIYNTETKGSTEQIAKDLCRLATTESFVPERRHPVAEIVSRFWIDMRSSVGEAEVGADRERKDYIPGRKKFS